jgi:hypothetical protein
MDTIGRIVATETRPNTAYAFHFWARLDAHLGIGSVVKAVLPEATIYGTVVEAFAYNDLPNALADYLGAQGVPEGDPPTLRPEIRLFEAAVLRREPEDPVAAVGIGPVFEADASDLSAALGADKFTNGIPVGVYGSQKNPLPVYLDPDFLLGSEAAHLDVTGTSGLAAKTSFVEFVVQSIFQKFAGRGEDGVAAVFFNVKGGDLLYLDHPPKQPLGEEDLSIYRACGLEAKPFENVVYLAPYNDPTHTSLNTLRNNRKLTDGKPTQGFCYGLEEVLKHAEILMNKDDIEAKADALLQFLARDVAGNPAYVVSSGKGEDGTSMPATNLRELTEVLKEMLAQAERDGQSNYRSHHAQTIRKILNRLSNFSVRFPGLITSTGKTKNPLPDKFQDRTAYVIDISQVDVDAQDLVFAAVVSDLRDRMERKELGVRRVIVIVDELNKYAPSAGSETYVVRSLRDIAARGRYLGLVLFGAQQFRSRVDPQIVGNCANAAYGHIQMEELASPIYTVYSRAVREKLATANPGQMMIRHPHFGQPIFVRFPVPNILRGNDGMDMFPYSPPLGMVDSVIRHAVERSDGKLTEAQVREFIERIPVSEKMKRLARIGDLLVDLKGQSVKNLLTKICGPAVSSDAISPPLYEEDDPFRT